MSRLLIAILLALAGLQPVALAAPSAGERPARTTWARPVGGAVVEPFTYERAAPFAAGQHRGADLAARAGEPVRAPCGGTVTFAGRVPERGRGVTIRCGALTATLVELGRVRIAKGARVARGRAVAQAGRAPVHLGARRTGERFGYVDPLALLGDRRPPLGPAPAPARRPRVAARARTRTERAAPAPAVVGPAPVVAPRSVPALAWAGLGLVAAGLPLGALVRRRRRGVRRAAQRGLGQMAAPR